MMTQMLMGRGAAGGGGGLSVTASPTPRNVTLPGGGFAQTGSTTATPSGGVPGYTYSWARRSGGSGIIDADSPTSATTTFSTNLSIGDVFTDTFECTVTDSALNVAVSNIVTSTIREV